MVPGGIRIGTPAMTTRGFNEEDFKAVANFIHTGVDIALKVHTTTAKGKKLKEFKTVIESGTIPEIQALKQKVIDLATKFPAIAQNF